MFTTAKSPLLGLPLTALMLALSLPRGQAASPPPCAPPPLGLVDWWQAEGNANDFVGGLNGSLVGGVSFAPGEVGQAFSFNGGTGYIANSTPGLTSITNSYTMEFWAYPTAGRNSTAEDTSGLSGTSGQRYAIFPAYGGLGTVGAGVSVGTNGVSVFEHGYAYLSSLLVYNASIVGWTHIAVVYNNQQPSLYINGVLVHTGLVSTRISCPSTWLGESGANYGYYAGLLDEVSVYSRPLSAAEVQSIYNAGSSGKCTSGIAPTISSQPTAQTVPLGATAQFSVTASGTFPLTYQWNLNGSPVLGAASSTLVLTNVQSVQAGSYTVLVTNSVGSILSSNAVLTVLTNQTSCAPPPSGLVDWWPGEGNTSDIIGNLNGTNYNGTGFAPGEVNQAFSFNGVNNYIGTAMPGLTNIQNSYTMEFWAYPTASRATTTETTSGIGGTSGQRYAIFPNFGPNGIVGAGVSVGTNGVSVWEHAPSYLPSLLVYNTNIVGWTHIAVVYNSRQPSLYLNGVLVHTGLTSTQISCPSTWLGEAGLNYGYYAGLLDEVSIYKRPLSGSEVQAIYTAGAAGKCTAATPPTILSQPTNQTVVVGGVAAFSVTATGSAPLSYLWSHNGSNLTAATGLSLVLTNVQFSQAGSYSVMVTNLYGATNSANAVLTVNPPPPCDPPPAGLVDWWPGEGNANDTVGGLNGTLVSGTSFAPGEVGQAFSFDGIHNYVSNSVPGLTSIHNSYTMEFWAYPTASRVTTTETTGGIGGTSGQRYAIFPNYGGNGPAGAGVSVGTNGVSVWEHANSYLPSLLVYSAPIVGWTHIAVAYSNRQPSLYVNGSLVRTGLVSTVDSYPSTDLGEAGIGYGYYAGLLDEVSIYNRSLTGAEVQAIYLAGSNGKCANHAPKAANLAAGTKQNQPLSIATAKLLALASDPDNDPLTVTQAGPTSTNGAAVSLGANTITYAPNLNFVGPDQFSYTISDGRGGTATALVFVTVTSTNAPSGNMLPPVAISGGYQVSFLGVPGRSYTLQRATSVNGPWLTLATVTADGSGMATFADTNAPPVSAFYRTTYP